MPNSVEQRKAKDAERVRAFRKTPEYRAWREANRDRINKYKRDRRRELRASNPAYQSLINGQLKRLSRHLASLKPSPSVADLVADQQLKHIELTLYSRQKSKLKKALMRGCDHMGHISGAEMSRRYQQFGNACAYCRHKPSNPLDLEIEHVLAISQGGPHCLANIVPACTECNRSKSNRPWRQWYKAQSFYCSKQQRKIEQVLASTPYPVKQLNLLADWVPLGA